MSQVKNVYMIGNAHLDPVWLWHWQEGSAEAKAKKADLWSYLKAHTSPAVFHSIRYGFGGVTNLNFPKGDTIVIGCYRIAQKLFKFN